MGPEGCSEGGVHRETNRWSKSQYSPEAARRTANDIQAELPQPKESTQGLKDKRPYIFNGKHRGKQASRERKKIDKSVEREPAAILLQVKGPQLLQRLVSQNQTSDDLRDLR